MHMIVKIVVLWTQEDRTNLDEIIFPPYAATLHLDHQH